MPDVTKRQSDHYQDWANLVFAACLFLAPWVLQFSAQALAAWNAWAVATIVAVLAISALVRFMEWEEWLNAILGIWAVIAPWALGFSAVPAAMWSHVVLGGLIAVLAIWETWEVRFAKWKAHA